MARLEGFVDHFEEDMAVIAKVDNTTTQVSRKALPSNVREGDFIVEIKGRIRFKVDRKITELHHREIRRLSETFFE
jgi:hypothetical protein